MRGRTREAAQIAAGENAARLCCVTSRDAGRSWGGARDLTAEAVGGAEQGRWAPRLHGAGVRGKGGPSREGVARGGDGILHRVGVCTPAVEGGLAGAPASLCTQPKRHRHRLLGRPRPVPGTPQSCAQQALSSSRACLCLSAEVPSGPKPQVGHLFYPFLFFLLTPPPGPSPGLQPGRSA